jgi:nucleoside-diphosphate-sugar epimerase
VCYLKILVLGGTGAMGVPLVKILEQQQHTVCITSRSKKKSSGHLRYIQGDAKDYKFFISLLSETYDVIVDFMIYESSDFEQRLPLLLESTRQYFFFSSSRVYAQTEGLIKEESPRLLDICNDENFLETDEYALSKAREENLLKNSSKRNWTIIRPYITYNNERLQLGVYEKEDWLYRALNGYSIILPKDIAEKTTTLTYGDDVANVVVKLIGNDKAFGETFHIASKQFSTWKQVLEIYLKVIEKKTGIKPKVKFVENSKELLKVWNHPDQIRYDRLYNRKFDDEKIQNVCGPIQFKDLYVGIEECLSDFLENVQWKNMNWKFEAWADKVSHERQPILSIPGKRTKLCYAKWRYFSRFG